MNLEEAYQLLDKSPGGETARMRRRRLLKFLFNERYLTRKGLSGRLEIALGADCSGWDLSWIVFILDMSLVRRAFKEAGYQLAYNWVGERRGFYLKGEGELSQEMVQAIKGAVVEVDSAQVEVTRRLTPAQRVHQGCLITDLAHSAVRYRQGINRKT